MHLSLNRIPWAGAWLSGLPDSTESHIPAPLFRVSLRRRLRIPVRTQDTNCTLCGQFMDKWGDHALVCGCGGDRVTRHNLVRDVVHSAATLEQSSRSLGSSSLVTPRMMAVPLLLARPSGPLLSFLSPGRRLGPPGPQQW